MRLDRRIKQGDVTFNGRGHRLPVPLSALGAALDVGEEEGDGAAGEIGHDVRSAPLCKLRSRWQEYERLWYDAHR
jgi:hypothetical protein